MKRRFLLLASCFVATRGWAEEVQFNRDIRPILSEHCLNCHGQDEKARKGELRLDVREGALKGGKSGDPAIVAGAPEKSELVDRITSQEEDEVMPPPKAKNPLKPEEIAKLESWIAGGAVYQPHWAFIPPVKAEPPGAGKPIDAFVRARLVKEGMTPAQEAAPEILCRRVYLDLIGIPPSPKEVEAFVHDFAQDREGAYGALVDRLLASPHFGERWARPWLDAARYADSDGYEKDLPRQQWAWRDWVIRALNEDLPYDQFVTKQIAGDLLPDATEEDRIATGFLRNGMVNEEGAILVDQFRMEGMFDRMDCLGKAVLGLTIQCAQCHSHKFDPLTHEEYYRIFAFLNDTYETTSRVYTAEQQKAIEKVRQDTAAAAQRFKSSHADWEQEMAAWEAGQRQAEDGWKTLTPTEPEWIGGLAHPQVTPDGSVLTLGFRPTDGELIVYAETMETHLTGLRMETLTQGDLPFGGPGRSVRGTFALSELAVEAQKKGSNEWKKVALTNASADFATPEKPLDAPFRKPGEDKRRVGPASFLIDGNNDTGWSPDRGPGRRNMDAQWAAQFAEPLGDENGLRLKFTLKFHHGGGDPHGRENNFLGRFRLSVTSNPGPKANAISREILTTPPERRTEAQKEALLEAWLGSDKGDAAAREEIDKAWAQFPEADTSILRLAQRAPEESRETFMLERGNWQKPARKVTAGVPAFLNPLPEGAGTDRLTFARWLTDRRAPTTARVAVNRTWQTLFGQGLADTPEDFGVRAPLPAEPELLDWLAVDLMDHGWSLKSLIRTIALSDTYRQSSQVSPDLLARDPRNRFLARGPRFRADAEVVRDIALAASGLLFEKVGGPSIFPPVPQSVFASSFMDVDFWKAATGQDRYRRALYVFRRRSLPDPVLSSFDAPNGDLACARRNRSNTPLAALATMNEPVFVEAARALALRVLKEGGADDTARVRYAFVLCTSRAPKNAEIEEALALLHSRKERLAEGWLSAREITTGDPKNLPELPPGATPSDAAAWTIVARVLLNLDETVTKS